VQGEKPWHLDRLKVRGSTAGHHAVQVYLGA
jgi:hypothetical protein